jgi:hypothetical protein
MLNNVQVAVCGIAALHVRNRFESFTIPLGSVGKRMQMKFHCSYMGGPMGDGSQLRNTWLLRRRDAHTDYDIFKSLALKERVALRNKTHILRRRIAVTALVSLNHVVELIIERKQKPNISSKPLAPKVNGKVARYCLIVSPSPSEYGNYGVFILTLV